MKVRSAWRLIGALLVAVHLPWGACWAESATPMVRESSVKAAFLYRFADFVEWPPDVFPQAGQPFVIGVSGDGDVARDLEQLVKGRTIEGRPVAVRRIAEPDAPSGVHLLFLGHRRESRLREILEALTGPVLVVTEQAGALRLGSVLNFIPEGGRVRFSASMASAEARSLKLSARLLAVAQAIEGYSR